MESGPTPPGAGAPGPVTPRGGPGAPQPPAAPPLAKPPADAATPGAAPAAKPEPVEERIDGLRAWIAQLDRRLGIRTWVGAVALVLALAAGIVGVVLAIDARDESATKADARALSEQIDAVQKEASSTAQRTVAQLNERVDALEQRMNTIASGQRTSDSKLSVVEDDINELRSQIAALERTANSGGSSLGGGGKP